MDYEEVLKLCGAEVLYMGYFGSYQGDWWAKVKYNNKTGWINEPFGSCSGCDILHSIIDNNSHDHGDDYFSVHTEELKEDCQQCMALKEKLITLGQGFLSDIMSQEEAELKAEKNLEWDYDAKEMLFQIKMYA